MASAGVQAQNTQHSDAEITECVMSALQQDFRIEPSTLEISTKAGAVTLTGTVSSVAARQRAVDLAAQVFGVVSVADRVTVSPSMRPQADIIMDVRRRIMHDQMLQACRIDVTATDATITLQGIVQSLAESQHAAVVAGEVRGVRAVNNDLVIETAGTVSDSDLTASARARLAQDLYLNGHPFEVKATNGVVVLSGAVDSPNARMRAGRAIRQLRHVKRVDNMLKVQPTNKPEIPQRNAKVRTDTQLAEGARAVIGMDARVHASKVIVKAKNGRVTLSGTVPYAYQKSIAGQDARSIAGVAWVTNSLMVNAVPREDKSLVADIASCFTSDYLLNGSDITVRANDGRVTLTGNASSKLEHCRAEQVASRIVGVKEVKNFINVQRERYSDTAIVNNVRERLSHDWITAKVHDYIGIASKEGVVTLDGEVNDWCERQQAEFIACNTIGVWSVRNNLAVLGAEYAWKDGSELVMFSSPNFWTW
jgi:osmotically-inducible protein OsmY